MVKLVQVSMCGLQGHVALIRERCNEQLAALVKLGMMPPLLHWQEHWGRIFMRPLLGIEETRKSLMLVLSHLYMSEDA